MDSFIGECVGRASMCWESPEKAGVFDSTAACSIAGKLEAHFNDFARCRKVVCEAMQEDEGLRLGYQANIAMCLFENIMSVSGVGLSVGECNLLADKLMGLLYEVKSSDAVDFDSTPSCTVTVTSPLSSAAKSIPVPAMEFPQKKQLHLKVGK